MHKEPENKSHLRALLKSVIPVQRDSFSGKGSGWISFFALVLLALSASDIFAQVEGRVSDKDGKLLSGATVVLRGQREYLTYTDSTGTFQFHSVKSGDYSLIAFYYGYELYSKSCHLEKGQKWQHEIRLNLLSKELSAAEVQAKREQTFGLSRMRSVDQFGLYEAKKTEVILLDELVLNRSTNNPRQAYGKIAGLNIWESDGAGLQLGIGGRGLSPNRSANFNIRQNGYDISADALGYPESYYTPPLEAIERIEVVRGAASLQYGTQFGGLVNFKFKTADPDYKWQAESRQTLGSWNFLNAYNRFSGSAGRWKFFAFYQRKQGEGWRENSDFHSNTAYAQASWTGKKWDLNAEYTHMNYLAQQAGGLTDRMFELNPRQSVRPRNWFNIHWNLFSLTANHVLGERTELNIRNFGLISSRQSLGNLERINVSDLLGGNRTLIAGNFVNFGNETRLLYKINSRHTLLLGSRLYNGSSTAKQGDASPASDADFRLLHPSNPEGSDYQFRNLNASLFGEYIFKLGNHWSLAPGVRLEHINTTANGFYRIRVFDFAGNLIADQRIEELRERPRTFLIGGMGVSYKPAVKKEWYANLSQNYRAINYTDLRVVNPNFQIDSNLMDERGFTADLGFRGSIQNKIKIDGGFFLISYNNKIGQVLVSDQPPLYLDYRLRTNISNALSRGIELVAESNLNSWFLFPKTWDIIAFTNLSYTDARYLRSAESSIRGKKVEMVPPFIARSGIQYTHKQFSGSVQHNFVAAHFSDATNAVRTSSAVEGLIPSYQVIDLSLQYRFKQFRVEATVNNLLNERYFTRRAESYPGPGIIPSEGRGFYLSLIYQAGRKKVEN